MCCKEESKDNLDSFRSNPAFRLYYEGVGKVFFKDTSISKTQIFPLAANHDGTKLSRLLKTKNRTA